MTKKLRWTKDPPTNPGWYWVRWPNETEPPEVVKVVNGMDDGWQPGLEWAGPIPMPEEN